MLSFHTQCQQNTRGLPLHLNYHHLHRTPAATAQGRLPKAAPCNNALSFSVNTQSIRSPRPKLQNEVSSYRAFSVVRLLRIEEGGAYADVLSGHGEQSWENEMEYLSRTLGFTTLPLDSRGQRQVTDVVAGITRWKRYLDFLIMSHYNASGYDHMEPLLRQILRLGVYELVKTDTPPYAALNENVKLSKMALRDGAGNLVNGILRSISRNQKQGNLKMPTVQGDGRARARALATLHSHPVWIVRRWISRYGEEETIKLMEWNNRPPIYSIRANAARGISREQLLQKLEDLEVISEPSLNLEDFVRVLSGMQALINSDLMEKGECSVQDESGGLVVRVCDPQPGETIVDCCAAPGGKALFMAACLEGQGNLLAFDINQGKLHLLEKAAKKLGVETVVQTRLCDLREVPERTTILADKVLVDAPCSGFGVLSKRADLRWRRVAEDMEGLISLQTQLLNAAARLVKPGGFLIYSTCSIEPEENENRVSTFLDGHPDFELQCVSPLVPEQFVTPQGYFATLPHQHNVDGAFAARLRRMS